MDFGYFWVISDIISHFHYLCIEGGQKESEGLYLLSLSKLNYIVFIWNECSYNLVKSVIAFYLYNIYCSVFREPELNNFVM